MKDTKMYVSAFSLRYASKQMQYIFSQQKKFSTWRKLWIALAETERELGLSENGRPVITKQMIEEMKKYVEDINFEDAEKYYLKAAEIYYELAKVDSYEYADSLAEQYEDLSTLYEDMEKPELAKEYKRRAKNV